jgi:hypothetical protein
MFAKVRSKRSRSVRPVLVSLEERQLLNGTMPHHMEKPHVAGHVVDVKVSSNHLHSNVSHVNSNLSIPTIHVLNLAVSHNYLFTNFDGPDQGTNAGTGTNINGISNAGTVAGFAIDNNGNFNNFTADPPFNPFAHPLNIEGSTTAMALGINSFNTVVGTDGNGNAFYTSGGKVITFIPPGGTSAVAFGINDEGMIVGQYVTSTGTPGFVRVNADTYITINAPSGPNIVNAQSINNHGLVVGFYVGTDGQDHGFMANINNAKNGVVTGVAIPDPTIPTVAGEPGATFVFSQILGINDKGIAVGYYGDSTTSQHGYFYNTRTGVYTFLDDPSEAFDNGVEVTQITGINDSGEISGFYSDANGVFHGFVGLDL